MHTRAQFSFSLCALLCVSFKRGRWESEGYWTLSVTRKMACPLRHGNHTTRLIILGLNFRSIRPTPREKIGCSFDDYLRLVKLRCGLHLLKSKSSEPPQLLHRQRALSEQSVQQPGPGRGGRVFRPHSKYAVRIHARWNRRRRASMLLSSILARTRSESASPIRCVRARWRTA